MEREKKFSVIICCILTVLFFYIGFRIAFYCEAGNILSTVTTGLDSYVSHLGSDMFNIFKMKVCTEGFVIGFILSAIVWIAWMYMYMVPKPERVGEEHGSSRWGTDKEIEMFSNKELEDKNIVLSNHARLATQRKKFNLNADRNLNVAVIGGSGSGKTRYYVKPNLMQLHGNYFVTDPKGTVVDECGHLLNDNGYEVKCFNVIPDTMNCSLSYNPLYYVKTKEQIMALVNCLIKNTNGKKNDSGDPFWEKSEILLYISIISFMQDWLPQSEFSLPYLNKWLGYAEAQEDNENFQSSLDLLFQQVGKGLMYIDPNDDSDADVKRWKQLTGQDRAFDEIRHDPVEGFKVVNTKQEVRGMGVLSPQPGMIDIPSSLQNQHTGKTFMDLYQEKVTNAKGEIEPKIISPQEWDEVLPLDDFSVAKYNQFKTAAGKTLKSIIISCNVRLLSFDLPALREILKGKPVEEPCPWNPDEKRLVAGCEMELDKLGDPDKKACIFAIMSDTNDTFFYLVAIMMYQVIDLLCNVALTKYHGKLPTFVHFIFDEFANLGVLSDFERTIAITRSRNIGVSMILQTQRQLENNYKPEAAQVIIDNCDTMIYLGGGSDGADKSVCKEISARLGKETIHTRTYNQTKGKNGSTSLNNAIQSRELMMPDEVARMPRDEELVLIKGTYPYKDKKFILESHKRYKFIDPESHIGKDSVHKNNFNYYDFKVDLQQKYALYGVDFKNNMRYWDESVYNPRKDEILGELAKMQGEIKKSERSDQRVDKAVLKEKATLEKELNSLRKEQYNKYLELWKDSKSNEVKKMKEYVVNKQKEYEKNQVNQRTKKYLDPYDARLEFAKKNREEKLKNRMKRPSREELTMMSQKNQGVGYSNFVMQGYSHKNNEFKRRFSQVFEQREREKVQKIVGRPPVPDNQPPVQIASYIDRAMYDLPDNALIRSKYHVRVHNPYRFKDLKHYETALNKSFILTNAHINLYTSLDNVFFLNGNKLNFPTDNKELYLEKMQKLASSILEKVDKENSVEKQRQQVIWLNEPDDDYKSADEFIELFASTLSKELDTLENTNIKNLFVLGHTRTRNKVFEMFLLYEQKELIDDELKKIIIDVCANKLNTNCM